MEEQYCFLCRDSEDILYKICDCNDSIICIDCYNNEATSKMNKCGICRKDYKFDYKCNYIKLSSILCTYLLKYGVIIGFEIFPPLYLYLQTEYSSMNNVLLFFTLFFVLFGNTILYKLIHIYLYHENDENHKNFLTLFIPLKITYLMILFIIIMFCYKKDLLLVYNYFVLGFIYLVPMLFFSTIMIGFYIKKLKIYVDEHAFTREIKIKSIIQNNLQSPINYV